MRFIYIRFTGIQEQSNQEHILILSSLIFKQLSLFRTKKEMSKGAIVYENKIFHVESIDEAVQRNNYFLNIFIPIQ